MYCAEGIDKIGVILNPLFFDKKNIIKHNDPYNRLTLHPAGRLTILSIHQEWFNPFFDYQIQIALAIYELIKEGVIDFPDTIFTPLFIYKNHSLFILNVVSCEFFFDFRQKNIEINQDMVSSSINEAFNEGMLYQYFDKKTNALTDTFYSPDIQLHSKSQFICYNKLRKSIKDNNIASVEELSKNQREIRCEYKIYSCNSEWLHWDNFQGNYKTVFNRYKEYLAVLYNKYISGCLTVHGKENPNFKKIIKIAERDNKIRFTNLKGKLKKREVHKRVFSEEKLNEKVKKIMDNFEQFSVKKMRNIKSRKSDEISSLLRKNEFSTEKGQKSG
jgi:hypothetical protein